MLFITAYFDESGSLQDPNRNFTGIAGFVAPLEVWNEVEKEWDEVVKKPEFALTEYFHMKDLYRRDRGQFAKWDSKRRDDLLKELVSTLVKAEVVPIGSLVSNGAYKSLTLRQQKLFRNPYTTAFQDCVYLASLSAGFLEPEKVSFVFAHQREYGTVDAQGRRRIKNAGSSERLFFAMKDHTLNGEWIGSYGVSTPQESIPLQAADILAWELTREFEVLIQQEQQPEMRESLRELLRAGGDQPLIRLYDRIGLLRLAKENSCPDQTGVEEVEENNLQQMFARRAAQDILFLRRGLRQSTVYSPRWVTKAIDTKYGREQS